VPVILSTAIGLVREDAYDQWCALEDEPTGADPSRRVPATGRLLEAAFDAGADDYLALGKRLGAEPSGGLAHAAACAVNPSDMGLMLAWSRVVEAWAGEARTVLVLCRDPWMYRHLAAKPGVATAGPPPPLAAHAATLWLRGYLSRIRFALRAAAGAVSFRGHRARVERGESCLLVYAHPSSTAAGRDGFFGDLIQRLPGLRRVLHTDRPFDLVRELVRDGRTVSLHGWGNPISALALPFAKWRPGAALRRGPEGWLVRRAAALEGGGGTAAAIQWQRHCQHAWLTRARPRCVAWPWENHNWERAFVRQARAAGARTAGYQHSVIGHQMLNHAVGSNPDGLASIPERVVCNGAPTMQQLADWGLPAERLVVGGALRYPEPQPVRHDAAGPVFLALPFDGATAAQMVEAAKTDASGSRRYLVKAHPIYGFDFEETETVKRTDTPLTQQSGLAGVVYAATTVGLEALLGGLPVLRFRPRGRIAIDILPKGLSVPVTDPEDFGAALAHLEPASAVRHSEVFAPVDMTVWSDLLGEGAQAHGIESS